MMSEYFKEVIGVSKNRSAIYTSLKKIDVYYSSHKEFRCFYDSFFKDKFELRLEKEARRKEYLNAEYARKIQLKPVVSFINHKRRLLLDTVSKLPDHRIIEIKELIDLRIKSWSWKSKDNCQIIEASEGIESSSY